MPAVCSGIVDSCSVQRYNALFCCLRCAGLVRTIKGDILLHQLVVAGSTKAYLFACRVCDCKSRDSTHRSPLDANANPRQ